MTFDSERAPEAPVERPPQRSTAEGRRFGDVSYAAQNEPRTEDLRRPSGAIITSGDVVPPSRVRTTSERKSRVDVQRPSGTGAQSSDTETRPARHRSAPHQ